MRNIGVMFSKASDHWSTPYYLYDYYFKFHNCFDPCPLHSTFDGLSIPWPERVFVNPPYSDISRWVDKAILEAKKGKEVILLLPARTDTKWFHKLYYAGARFKFIIGRLSFGGCGKPAPFPSVLVSVYRYSNFDGLCEFECVTLDALKKDCLYFTSLVS